MTRKTVLLLWVLVWSTLALWLPISHTVGSALIVSAIGVIGWIAIAFGLVEHAR